MDEKRVKQGLNDIAQRDIPGDMPSLWPAIQRQITPQPAAPSPWRRVPTRRLAWIMVALVVSLMFSAGTYAYYRYQQAGDSGLEQVQDEELITEIGQSRTLNGVTITLDWAYADAHRVALGYHISGKDESGSLTSPTGIGQLFDNQGHQFPPMFGGGGGDRDIYEASANFDASIVQGAPEELNLRLELYVVPADAEPPEDVSPSETPPPTPIPDESTGGTGSGGGGGGGGGGGCGGTDAGDYECEYSFNGFTEDPRLGMEEAVGPFVFEFSVPFIPAVEFTPLNTVTANDVAMTLESVAVTPSLTRVQVCYDAPSPEPWTPAAVLDTGNAVFEFQSVGFVSFDADAQRFCFELGFLAPYDRQPAAWTLTVTYLAVQIQPDPQVLRQMFAEYGIRIKIFPDGVRWETTYVPPDVDFGAAMQAVFDALTPRIDGPWVFRLDVPGS